jgi:transcription-repair coupling factor (superfamily II helicase)
MPSEALVTASTLSNLNINFESEFDYEYTLNYLSSNGYVRVSSIREPGEFSVKGDVIDIFPSEFAKPIRINLFGDKIEKFEEFELKTQKTIQQINRAIIRPFNEFAFNQGKRSIKADTFLSDLSSFEENDLIVHANHGIGKFRGLKKLEVLGNSHDCIELNYFNDDKLYVPVENIELLSKYGGNNEYVQVDKLGNSHWQFRKASAKNKIKEIAEELIIIAAKRSLKKGKKYRIQEPYYSNFINEFEFQDTEDQVTATSDILSDLSHGVPMDRLICGDVGFGKTEVALRGAFNVALNGGQVAIIVPTTLLCQQHYENFIKRFKNYPIKIGQLSRLVSASETISTQEKINNGELDIVVGTHALLGNKIKFKNLGMLIIDEEQHFGVSQKEKIKNLRSDIHVLSLTATPIPRTLQMSLVGLRDLSIISTAPLNRQSIATEVINFNEKDLTNAIEKELERNGQIYYVCPRIKELQEVEDFLKKAMPELKYKIAHGQMSPKNLKNTMIDFYNNEFQLLLCTTIVESGLDLQKTNTMIIHNADKFGLSQLYQLRGRIGRSNIEAFCYYTVKDINGITENSFKRLSLLKKFNSRGSSFNLASHDLDMRGSGNIIGDAQSGHIKEIGLELYHRLLKDKIIELKNDSDSIDNDWSPQLNLGLSVLIPEKYIPNLNTRLFFYRKLAYLNSNSELIEVKKEMEERFGLMPNEVNHLFKITELRILCKQLSVEKFDLGKRGLTIKFRNNKFDKTDKLIDFINLNKFDIKLRTDQTLVYNFSKINDKQRIYKAFSFAKELASL